VCVIGSEDVASWNLLEPTGTPLEAPLQTLVDRALLLLLLLTSCAWSDPCREPVWTLDEITGLLSRAPREALRGGDMNKEQVSERSATLVTEADRLVNGDLGGP